VEPFDTGLCQKSAQALPAVPPEYKYLKSRPLCNIFYTSCLGWEKLVKKIVYNDIEIIIS
jgi:hypothetical protein